MDPSHDKKNFSLSTEYDSCGLDRLAIGRMSCKLPKKNLT